MGFVFLVIVPMVVVAIVVVVIIKKKKNVSATKVDSKPKVSSFDIITKEQEGGDTYYDEAKIEKILSDASFYTSEDGKKLFNLCIANKEMTISYVNKYSSEIEVDSLAAGKVKNRNYYKAIEHANIFYFMYAYVSAYEDKNDMVDCTLFDLRSQFLRLMCECILERCNLPSHLPPRKGEFLFAYETSLNYDENPYLRLRKAIIESQVDIEDDVFSGAINAICYFVDFWARKGIDAGALLPIIYDKEFYAKPRENPGEEFVAELKDAYKKSGCTEGLNL